MINVVLDTNVLMASLIKKEGTNRAALRKVLDPRAPFSICFSSQIADEYAEVLHRYPISSRGLIQEADDLLKLVGCKCNCNAARLNATLHLVLHKWALFCCT